MLNYQTWLETPGKTIVFLVEIERTTATITERLSTHNVTVSGNTYTADIKNSFEISESINTDYAASISYGSIDIQNANGERDAWLNSSSYIWVNKVIRVYVGSVTTSSSLSNDFELIFDGLIADLDSKDRNTLSFKVRDRLEKLNTSISEALLGNYFNGNSNVATTVYDNQNKNSLRPVCFGEVFNITPLLTDPVYLEYMVNNSVTPLASPAAGTELIIEVRDNGVPVPFTTGGTIPVGSFRLLRSPAGTVTCSLQGVQQLVNTTTGAVSTGYDPSAKNTILVILTSFGKQLAAAEIDLASFASATSYGNQAVGIYLSDRANVLQVCQQIAKSCGCVLTINSLGKVKLVELALPGTLPTTIINDNDTFLNSLVVARRIDVIAGVKLGICKNYTQQTNLVTAITQESKDAFASTVLDSVKTDNTTKTNYSITTEPTTEESYLVNLAEADVQAQTRLDLFKAARTVYRMRCTSKFLSLQVGTGVQLKLSRFNLWAGGAANGATGLVLSVKPDWRNGDIELEVLV